MNAGIPPLARALGARLRSLIQVSGLPDDIDRALIPVVSTLDAADRRYRAAIEAALPPANAREVLGTMSAFRHAVLGIRERAATEAKAAFGAFDPLDTYVPPPHGLSHADGVRAAGVADRARAEVTALRVQANERIRDHIGANPEALLAARRERNRLFNGAIHAAILAVADTSVSTLDPIVEPLATLAEAWY